MASKSNLTIAGRSVKELINKAFDQTRKHGQSQQTYLGDRKTLHNTTLIFENADEEVDRYPFWEEIDEQWYLNQFVRPATGPPEALNNPDYVFPYTYSWRARYFDQGYGHALQVVRALQEKNYTDLPLTRKEDIDQIVRETSSKIHPDLLLTVIHWLGRSNLKKLLPESESNFLKQMVNSSRRDLLLDVTNDLNDSLSKNEPSVAISNYPNIDNLQMIETRPHYLQFQIAPIINASQNVVGLESFHLYRHLFANHSLQLEFAHAREWASYIEDQTGLPVNKTTFYTQQLYLYEDKEIDSAPDRVEDFVMSQTTGYDPKRIDIDQLTQMKRYEMKVARVLEVF